MAYVKMAPYEAFTNCIVGANATSFISLTRFGRGLLRGQCHHPKTMLRISPAHMSFVSCTR